MLERLSHIEARYDELSQQLADPALVSDQQQYQKVTKQHRDLEEVVDRIRRLKHIQHGIQEAKAMTSESDADIRAMAEEELAQLQAELPTVEEQIRVLLLPKDPNDEKNVILEIRAGTGGDEASLFAAEL
ncbi:MAG: PCRF domain-containing protein, partial [Acidobacteriaceae bacterium]